MVESGIAEVTNGDGVEILTLVAVAEEDENAIIDVDHKERLRFWL